MYRVQSIVHQGDWHSCSKALVRDGDLNQLLPLIGADGAVSHDVKAFLSQLNRGRLVVPSNAAFAISLKCWCVFSCIVHTERLKQLFLSNPCQRNVFVQIVSSLIADDNEIEEIVYCGDTCDNGNCYLKTLVNRFYNCLASNFAELLSGETDKRDYSRKLSKLKGCY